MIKLDNYSEQEIVDILTDIGNKLAPKFKFGCYGIDDIRQEVYIQGLKLLERGKYDGKRPLANFLFFAIKNQLKNLKRDKYERLEPPCLKCPFNAYNKKEDKCELYERKIDCEPYYKFTKRNNQKKQLMHGETVDFYPNENTRGSEGDLAFREKEINQYIDMNLPVQYRADYLKLKCGDKLPAGRREFIEDLLLSILTEGGFI